MLSSMRYAVAVPLIGSCHLFTAAQPRNFCHHTAAHRRKHLCDPRGTGSHLDTTVALVVLSRLVSPRMEPMEIAVMRVRPTSENLPLPRYMTEGAAGMDLLADLTDPVELASGGRALIPTGLAVEIPVGFEAQIRPRSGLALRHGITLLNSPGTIDADYRGEIMVLIVNLGDQPFTVRRGERIAQ